MPSPSLLRKCFDKYSCDKGKKHGYERCYEEYFEPVRKEENVKILEVGCFRGESIRAWEEYFPYAEIYTIDIFTRTDPREIMALKSSRVDWLKFDSTNAAIFTKLDKKWPGVKFDFIIDDGAHHPASNLLTFENLFSYLKEDGAYFIEDVWMLDRMKPHSWTDNRPHLYSMPRHIQMMTELEKHNVKHYDFRKTNAPDSYILRVKHAS